MIKIIVDSEELKQQILRESKYVHDYKLVIRSNKTGKEKMYMLDDQKAGLLMHIYTNPDIIEVKQ